MVFDQVLLPSHELHHIPFEIGSACHCSVGIDCKISIKSGIVPVHLSPVLGLIVSISQSIHDLAPLFTVLEPVVILEKYWTVDDNLPYGCLYWAGVEHVGSFDRRKLMKISWEDGGNTSCCSFGENIFTCFCGSCCCCCSFSFTGGLSHFHWWIVTPSSTLLVLLLLLFFLFHWWIVTCCSLFTLPLLVYFARNLSTTTHFLEDMGASFARNLPTINLPKNAAEAQSWTWHRICKLLQIFRETWVHLLHKIYQLHFLQEMLRRRNRGPDIYKSSRRCCGVVWHMNTGSTRRGTLFANPGMQAVSGASEP